MHRRGIVTYMSEELTLPTESLSVRERGKQRRRIRIKEAARTVFQERGYEAATTREIADRADVSQGTLFAYAPTKSELLLMIINDDLEVLRADRFGGETLTRPLIEILLGFAGRDMAYWARYPEMARQARREVGVVLLGRPSGPEALRYAAWKPTLLQSLAAIVRDKQHAGFLRPELSAELVAELWWAIYNQNLHNWLVSNKPDVAKGLSQLRNLLQLAIAGIQPFSATTLPAAH